ncbi:MAG: molybdopterin molybdotransferase MoeA [Rhizobiaceae bacterium]
MNEAGLIDDCFLHDKDRLRHDEALKLLQERLSPITGTEAVSIGAALGRVAAKDIVAPHNVPLHTNSAVDGYAFAHCDLGPKPFPVSLRIAAGDLSPPALKTGTAARIFTGAPMPTSSDTVAMQEDCVVHESKVSVPNGLRKGANCRLAGEDLKADEVVVQRGKRLSAADLAALASIGAAEIPVHERLRIICFSSGNEMRRVETSSEPLQIGEVYDTNWPLLSSLMKSLPVDVTDGGVLGDTATQVSSAIKAAAGNFEIILTTGGASRGEEDHMLATLDNLGKRHLWQLALKPGRPMMFGQIPRPGSTDCLFFGLPGNPVAAMVCFLLYARPALLHLAGADWKTPPRFALPADFEVTNKKPDRREFLRGILDQDENGTMRVKKFPRDGSGLISSLREADGLIELPEEMTELEKGTPVNFIPFSSFD